MGENTPNIDNRYSSIYQRGGGSSTTPGDRWPVPKEPPQQRRAVSEAHTATSPEQPANVVEVMPAGAVLPDPGPAHPRFNPFVLVLWLLGAAMLAFGLWAVFAPLQVDQTAVSGPFPQWIFIISQSAGGIIVSASILLTAAGALSAVFWDRRRRLTSNQQG
ncbi:hypothetical protein ASH00_05655 [Arthrobacter sp. Soil782]|uniref:tetraspanin family protein n=1 Tax=Arthrobacter sp. Soil782 TaxID=1736410 RepID=UPI0006FC5845|nr:tetraspanin family protein [Arthrobacter sp. Soil782]KRF09137.1 hypothetical protein ASH00_05655 [Arthrobacter sp. Soil782]